MDTNYYILIFNDRTNDENREDNFHLENIFSIEQATSIINSDINKYFLEQNYNNKQYRISDCLILTNDNDLLYKYLSVINIDEFNLICKKDKYDKSEIRIDKDFFSGYNCIESLFKYVTKILNSEIISATMSWHLPAYISDEEFTKYRSFGNWVENMHFIYLKVPDRYKTQGFYNIFIGEDIFGNFDIRKANIILLSLIMNYDILKIGNDENQTINWEYRNGLLRYYDKISCTRLYISQELLNIAKENNEQIFEIETKLDENYYIEYYVRDLYIEEEEEEDDEWGEKYLNNNSSRYSKYNGAYGYDDDAIDSGFDGNPENYWNID